MSDHKTAREIIKYCLKYVHVEVNFVDSDQELTPESKLFYSYEEWTRGKSPPKSKMKLFNDPIHGSVLLNPLENAIINTEEFYRLRDIKQLGGKSHVYPGAVHTRFEHSIGVCHLAGEFVKHLRQSCPSQDAACEDENIEELITTKEELCIRLAGLCHDLGHGPFSHVFDYVKDEVIGKDNPIKHETLSVQMFRTILIKHPKVLFAFVSMGLTKDHVELIGEMIDCSKEFMNEMEKDKQRNKKIYLYEIVANKLSGIDVDKWDYFARDCYFLGVKNEFDTKRCMTLSKIIEYSDTGSRHIAFRDKEYQDIYGMFRTRCMIHQKACSHKVVSAIEMMIKDAMVAAKELSLFGFPDNQNTIMQILESIRKTPANLSGFVYLSDNILDKIRTQDTSKRAKNLVLRIINRDTYSIASGEVIFPEEDNPIIDPTSRENLKSLHHLKHPENSEVDEGYEIDCALISYASEEKDDPVQDVHFFTKDCEDISVKIPKLSKRIMMERSLVTTPKSLLEYRVRLFRKQASTDEDQNALEWFFDKVDKAVPKKGDTTKMVVPGSM